MYAVIDLLRLLIRTLFIVNNTSASKSAHFFADNLVIMPWLSYYKIATTAHLLSAHLLSGQYKLLIWGEEHVKEAWIWGPSTICKNVNHFNRTRNWIAWVPVRWVYHSTLCQILSCQTFGMPQNTRSGMLAKNIMQFRLKTVGYCMNYNSHDTVWTGIK